MLLLCKCIDYQGLRKVSILGHQDLLISSLQGHFREKRIACEKDSRRGVFTVCRSFLCALILFLSAQFLQSWSRETDGNTFFARRKKRMMIKYVSIIKKGTLKIYQYSRNEIHFFACNPLLLFQNGTSVHYRNFYTILKKNPLPFGIANRNSYRILKMSTHTQKKQMTVELFPNDKKLQQL